MPGNGRFVGLSGGGALVEQEHGRCRVSFGSRATGGVWGLTCGAGAGFDVGLVAGLGAGGRLLPALVS